VKTVWVERGGGFSELNIYLGKEKQSAPFMDVFTLWDLKIKF